MSFSQLDHGAQLHLLEGLTRAALGDSYGLDAERLRMEAQQYEDNAVWRVTTADGSSFGARLSVRDGRPARQQRSEMRWLQSLAGTAKVAVPVPVLSAGGDFVVAIDVPGLDETSTLVLFHWVPGTADPPYHRTEVAAAMGAATAHLHANAAAVPLPDFDRPVWDAQTILFQGHALTHPAARRQLGAEGVGVLREVARRIGAALDAGSPADRGRIHGDLHRENMIALPEGGIGIIDFDDCGTGHYLFDIATVLSSVHRLAGSTPGAYENFVDAYLSGYKRVRPLPADFEELLEPYLLLRDAFILDFVTAAVPRNEAVAAWGPGRIAGIVAHMQAYLAGSPYPGAF